MRFQIPCLHASPAVAQTVRSAYPCDPKAPTVDPTTCRCRPSARAWSARGAARGRHTYRLRRTHLYRHRRTCLGGTDGSTNWQEQRPGHECVNVYYTFLLLRYSGSPSGDWVGGRQWTALLYTHSSRRCAAPRLLSPKPSRGSHRPRLNLPSRTRAPNPPSRLGRPLQGVATPDGWPPAERPCPPLGFFRKRQNSERPAAGRRIYSPARTRLRTHGAMIGKESSGLDGGMGGVKTGTCSWGRAVPTYYLDRGPHRSVRGS